MLNYKLFHSNKSFQRPACMVGGGGKGRPLKPRVCHTVKTVSKAGGEECVCVCVHMCVCVCCKIHSQRAFQR